MILKLTIPLNELSSAEAFVAGGKGASLGELMRAGISVPPGFVVITKAFDMFMEGVHKPKIGQVIQQLAVNELSPEQAESEIATILAPVPLPQDVIIAVERAISHLGVERVSVRSSATCEDSGETAWAGQLDTYLNVKPKDVVKRLRNCWLSIFSKVALSYGAAHGYGADQFAVAVVIQKMVDSAISGIGFSVHPVTQEPDVMLIEACFGLGEAIVSGRIVPDQYVVARDSDEILEEQIGKQREGLFIQPANNSALWQQLEDDGAHRKLTKSQVIEYARLLTQIADHYGHPVDTEWAMEDGQFQVLQARPITTLAEEYDQPLIEYPDEWQRILRRPKSLLEASIFAHWFDSEHASDIGIEENRVLSIQDDAGMAIIFWPTTAFGAAMAHINELYQHDRPQLISILKQAQTIYTESKQKISQGELSLEDIDTAVDFSINVAQFTGTFPALLLIYYEQNKLDDSEIRTRAEALRADSLVPAIERHINTMVTRKMAEIGFSDPSSAPLVTTWSELRRGELDCDVLERRLKAVRSGKRFVFQSIDGEDSVRFVSQTGYLLMRLAKQRQVASDSDKNPDKLSGQTAWPGLYRGRARVILSPDAVGQTIEDGEVLISMQSSPALMPLLRRCGALVTDDGGIACHAAIIARELRVPTLIGTGCATSTIHTGDFLEVDTYQQVVRILEHSETSK